MGLTHAHPKLFTAVCLGKSAATVPYHQCCWRRSLWRSAMQTSGTPPRPGCPEGQSLPVEPWEKWPKRKSHSFYNHKYFLVLSYKQLSYAVDTQFPILCLKLKIYIVMWLICGFGFVIWVWSVRSYSETFSTIVGLLHSFINNSFQNTSPQNPL